LKRVLVFGASGSIGTAITQLLLEQDFEVVAIARDPLKLERLKNKVSSPGFSTHPCVDVTSPSSIDSLRDEFDRNDTVYSAIVYVVGNCPPNGFLQEVETPLSGLSETTLIENMGLYALGFHSVVRRLLARVENEGHIVAISSTITRFKANDLPVGMHVYHYAAAKAALNMLVEGFRSDPGIRQKNIRVHLIAPGAVATPFHNLTPKEMTPPAFLSIRDVAEAVLAALHSKTTIDQEMIAEPPEEL
jgi:NAD(P)-dependent dehydrogenase (short-subunit alcohol dehydrogenase family)